MDYETFLKDCLSKIRRHDDKIKQIEIMNQELSDALEQEKAKRNETLNVYRKASVIRVMEYVVANKLPDEMIQTYIIHCINKLNGNIDGVELDLGKEENNLINGT